MHCPITFHLDWIFIFRACAEEERKLSDVSNVLFRQCCQSYLSVRPMSEKKRMGALCVSEVSCDTDLPADSKVSSDEDNWKHRNEAYCKGVVEVYAALSLVEFNNK